MLCTVLCQKNFYTHNKIPGDLLDLVRKSKCISSILPIVMQSENKEGDVLCSGSCITNRFGRREVATESLICIICRKRRFQLDSLQQKFVVKNFGKKYTGKKKPFKKHLFAVSWAQQVLNHCNIVKWEDKGKLLPEAEKPFKWGRTEPACPRPPHTLNTLSWQVAPDGTLTQKLLFHRVCLQAEVVFNYKKVPPILVRGSLTSDHSPW